MVKRIGILGASCRAAAQSCAKAGFEVEVVDLFTDFDTRQVADVRVLKNLPWTAPKWLSESSVDAWCYAGGPENYRGVVRKMSKIRPLLGNSADTLWKVRNPFWLADVAERHQFAFPETHRLHDPNYDPVNPRRSEKWLVKPFKSGGGLRIETLRSLPELPRRFYLQRKLSGTPMSAAILSTKAGWQILGRCRLDVGRTYGVPGPFVFAGATLVSHVGTSEIRKMVDAVHHEANMIGLWGIDYIESDQATLLEVNPRWTASMALFDRQRDDPLMGYHVAACVGETVERLPRGRAGSSGSRIVYANRRLTFTTALLEKVLAVYSDQVADIPMPDTVIEKGHPICTLYVDGIDAADVESTISDEASRLRCLLYEDS